MSFLPVSSSPNIENPVTKYDDGSYVQAWCYAGADYVHSTYSPPGRAVSDVPSPKCT